MRWFDNFRPFYNNCATLFRVNFVFHSKVIPKYKLKLVFFFSGLKSLDQIILRAGSTILDRGGVRVPVNRIIKHPKYDVALLELTNSLEFNEYVKPIKLPRVGEKLPENQVCLTTGWGLTKENEQVKTLESRQLAGVSLRIIGHSLCQRYYHKQLRGHEICAGRDSGGVDACTADSGGPLACQTSRSNDDRTLFGIVALGVGCARPKSPGVYVNVLEIRQWIQQVTLV